ncbi:Aromatic-amino-acid aminotransferase 2 [Candidatus Lokiarchaeum ossiferum]|uniref:Aromatic-amino-acid aminotransferase 2 n=1 Tax=Candidatus Lokiarchaeum ossiferum TaxID=2951803 RepID=A0ABY6HZF5_9ARCH|nr:Aromatic-amino-acid aminotransferase 2 [Candidatus Lokiarchaeum sp. B-35]
MKISPFKLERYFAKYEFKSPYLLSSSDCESFSIQELLNLEENSRDKFFDHWLGYTESEGDPELRTEIANLYSTLSKDEIFCFAGAQEGIFVFLNTLLDKNDHIIVQFPAYQSLYEIEKAMGCEVSLWKLDEKLQWGLNLDFLHKNLRDNTKAIIINLPHNPTGMTISSEKLSQIVEFAQKNDLYLFVDEVYRYLEYQEMDRLPAIADIYSKGISLGVMSKAFGLAGLRIGWVATKDMALLAQMRAFKDYTTICNSAPSEFLAKIALKNKSKILQRNLNIINANLQLLDSFFIKYKQLFEWIRPKAGSIGFVKIKFDQNVTDFCLDLVEKQGVLLLPSPLYEFDEKHFRIGFGRKNMPEALTRLEQYVKENFNIGEK